MSNGYDSHDTIPYKVAQDIIREARDTIREAKSLLDMASKGLPSGIEKANITTIRGLRAEIERLTNVVGTGQVVAEYADELEAEVERLKVPMSVTEQDYRALMRVNKSLVDALTGFISLWPVLPERNEPKATPEVLHVYRQAKNILEECKVLQGTTVEKSDAIEPIDP